MGTRAAGSQTNDAVVDQIVRFDAAVYARVLAACAVVTEERGTEYTVADMISDAVSLAVQDIEKSADDVPDDEGAVS